MAGPSSGLHISLGYVASVKQRIDAGPGQLGAIPPKAVVEKWASDPIVTAEIMVIPAAVLGHSLGYVWLRLRRADEANDRSKGQQSRKVVRH